MTFKIQFIERLLNRLPFLRNKYIVTILFFVVWMLFFNEYNLISRYRNKRKIADLKELKESHNIEIERNKRLLNGLQGDDENMEKFAREQYLMKKDNEDIYIIIEE